jgi:hypothetical protein
MTVREFLELASASEEVYLYNLDNGSETYIEVCEMESLSEDILNAEVQSWDHHIPRDNKGWETVGARICINYSLED